MGQICEFNERKLLPPANSGQKVNKFFARKLSHALKKKKNYRKWEDRITQIMDMRITTKLIVRLATAHRGYWDIHDSAMETVNFLCAKKGTYKITDWRKV